MPLTRSREFLPALFTFGIVVLLTSTLHAQVRINEILASNRLTNADENGDGSDWLELYNAGAGAVNLRGFGLSDSADNENPWIFPSVEIPPQGHLLVWASGKDRRNFPSSTITERDSRVPLRDTLITAGSQWRYFFGAAGTGAPPADWTTRKFDDTGWASGPLAIGFDPEDAATVLPEQAGVLLLRHAFDVLAPQDLPNLVAEIRYDDAFVLFLNGELVATDNLPAGQPLTFDTLSDRSHSPTLSVRFDLTEFRDHLTPGANQLALAIVNRRSSRDLFAALALGTVPRSLHADFQLSRTGETVVLTNDAGAVVDVVRYPEQISDQSYGRSPDGGSELLYHLTPTPSAANDGPTAPFPLAVEDTKFSVDRGFFEQPFDLVIETATRGAEIRYTLDGSWPTVEHGVIYTRPLRIDRTTVVRAAAFRSGHKPSDVDTHTYLFLDAEEGGVLSQPELPAGFPPDWGTRSSDYAMDPRVVSQPDSPFYEPGVQEALLAMPSLCLTSDLRDLFDPQSGLYTHPQSEGVEWERPTSAELIHPDGTRGFQINAGLRVQGGASRNPSRPKHNLRLLFKRRYGPGKLSYPLFKDSPVDEFDTIILRGGNGDSWIHPNGTQRIQAQYIRDQWHRDTQLAMGWLSTHQLYVHLYINGLYWGLYHVFERANADFLASHLGGARQDYDSLNLGVPVDGDRDAWTHLITLGRGDLSSAAAYAEIQEYLHVPALIDYLLMNFYSGNVDWDGNNWYAGRLRAPGGQLRFFAWDAERTFLNVSENRTNLNNSAGPTGLHQSLSQNAEYRLLFADHIERSFSRRGALTREEAEARWIARAEEIRLPLVAEMARWGDNKRDEPYSVRGEWQSHLDQLRSEYFPRRSLIVFSQLKNRGLYPEVEPPAFSREGGRVQAPFQLVVSTADEEGTAYYTADGTDPRLEGDAIHAEALVAPANGFAVEKTTRVMARTLRDGVWSALRDETFLLERYPLRLTEIHYHPPPPSADSPFEKSDFEFLELRNVGTAPIALDGFSLRGGVQYDFAVDDLPPIAAGNFVILCANREALATRHSLPSGVPVVEYESRLSNAGETLILLAPDGTIVWELGYDDAWYPATDGLAYSLVLVEENKPVSTLQRPSSWTASRARDGSPGRTETAERGREGNQRAGDFNQDGRLSVIDPIQMLGVLFGQFPTEVPCDGEAFGTAGSLSLLDVDASGRLDTLDAVALLRFLFDHGAPPRQGTRCIAIAGCPDICAD